jgi:Rogdi leucine zipper containing protein
LLELRLLEPVTPPSAGGLTGFNFRQTLSSALLGDKKPDHDEVDQIFTYKGVEVRVREKVRVESGDPSLMAVLAKVGALEHHVLLAIRSLDCVMGKDE